MDYTAQENIENGKVETSENGVNSATETPSAQVEVVEEVIGKPVHVAQSENALGFGGCPAGYHRVGPICVPDDKRSWKYGVSKLGTESLGKGNPVRLSFGLTRENFASRGVEIALRLLVWFNG